jgi:hypothetical protein
MIASWAARTSVRKWRWWPARKLRTILRAMLRTGELFKEPLLGTEKEPVEA